MQQPTTPRRFTNSWGRLVVDPELETSLRPACGIRTTADAGCPKIPWLKEEANVHFTSGVAFHPWASPVLMKQAESLMAFKTRNCGLFWEKDRTESVKEEGVGQASAQAGPPVHSSYTIVRMLLHPSSCFV